MIVFLAEITTVSKIPNNFPSTAITAIWREADPIVHVALFLCLRESLAFYKNVEHLALE